MSRPRPAIVSDEICGVDYAVPTAGFDCIVLPCILKRGHEPPCTVRAPARVSKVMVSVRLADGTEACTEATPGESSVEVAQRLVDELEDAGR